LKEFALAAKNGKLIFRSPVTDFSPIKNIDISKSPELTTVTVDDNLGFLDHVLLMQNGFSAMSVVISEINERMRENTEKTQYVSDELNRTLASSDPNKLQKIQSLLGEFAVFQQKYAEFLKESNDKYEGSLDQTFTSLEFVITFQTPSTDEERATLNDLLSSLTLLENNSQLSLNSYAALVNSMQSTPKMEKTLNIAMEQVVIQINRFIGYTQQVVAMASRSVVTIEKLLGL